MVYCRIVAGGNENFYLTDSYKDFNQALDVAERIAKKYDIVRLYLLADGSGEDEGELVWMSPSWPGSGWNEY